MLTELKTMYADYFREAEHIRKNTRGMAGYMGLGFDPKQHPCHMEFYNRVKDWTAAFLAGSPEEADIYAAAEFMLQAADLHRSTDAYWYYFACQGHIIPMLSGLSKDSCRKLREEDDRRYPKKERLPVQEELYKKLKKLSK